MHAVPPRLMLVFAAALTAMAPIARAQIVVGPSSPAVETDREAAELVRACVERTERITRRTCERITSISFDAIARMRAQAQEGAPDEVLIDTARTAIGLMRDAAARGINGVGATTRECLQRLDELDASTAHARVVRRAHRRSVERIRACLHEGARRVVRALDALTGA